VGQISDLPGEASPEGAGRSEICPTFSTVWYYPNRYAPAMRGLACILLLLLPALAGDGITRTSSLAQLRAAVSQGTGIVEMPKGEMLLDSSLVIPKNAKGLYVRANPAGSTLVLGEAFPDRAAIVADGVSDLRLEGFEVRGTRTDLKSDWSLPPVETSFADFYSSNGILIRNSSRVTIRHVSFSLIRAYPVLANKTSGILIDSVSIKDCGTLNRAGRNNSTGGILLEESTSQFTVRHCSISHVLGNAIWTHSYATSPRSAGGLIGDNTISYVARDAIQIGHATKITVERNRADHIGFPPDAVDVDTSAYPVGLDTAGDVDLTAYVDNHFTDIDGHCIDLDGFHDGTVSRNVCLNRQSDAAYPFLHFGIVFGNNYPKMISKNVRVTDNDVEGFAFGGLFLIGSHNTIERNRFWDLNRRHCTGLATAGCTYRNEVEPGLLRSGIYLAPNGGRPVATRDNIIRDNTIEGPGMDRWCIGSAPDVKLENNVIANNRCIAASK